MSQSVWEASELHPHSISKNIGEEEADGWKGLGPLNLPTTRLATKVKINC